MKTLKKFEFTGRSGGLESKYNWDKLLDGGLYQLIEGEDFQCNKQSFIMQVRKQADRHGVGVKVQAVDEGVVLLAQTDPESCKAAKKRHEESKAKAAERRARKRAEANGNGEVEDEGAEE